MSIRLAWLARLTDANDWNNIANIGFNKYGGLLFLLKSNYDYRALDMSTFYKTILKYAEIVFENKNKIDIIWNNKDIRIGNKPVLSKYWIKKVLFPYKIYVVKKGCFLSYNELCHKYNVLNSLMLYIGILSNLKPL